jgi:hypothetical protein
MDEKTKREWLMFNKNNNNNNICEETFLVSRRDLLARWFVIISIDNKDWKNYVLAIFVFIRSEDTAVRRRNDVEYAFLNYSLFAISSALLKKKKKKKNKQKRMIICTGRSFIYCTVFKETNKHYLTNFLCRCS